MRYIFFFLAINYLIDFKNNDLQKFCVLNIFLLSFLAIDIWYQKFTGSDLFGYKSGMDGMRNSGFFGDEFIAGGFIVKVFFLTVVFFFMNKVNKIYFLIFYIFIFVTVFFTGERMALILFCIGSSILFFIYRDSIKYKTAICFTFLISIILIFTFSPQTRYRIIDQTINQIFYGTSDKLHKYFDLEILSTKIVKEKNNNQINTLLILDKQRNHEYENNFILNNNVKNLIKDINNIKHFKATEVRFDEYHIDNKYFERIDIQVEYLRGFKIKTLGDELSLLLEKQRYNSNISSKIKYPKKFKITKSIPIIDSGWGAHFLVATNIWLDKPIFGNGLKSFRLLCSEEKFKTISKDDDNKCSTHPHNFYFELLSETGLVGLILLIIIIIGILKEIKIISSKIEIIYLIVFVLILWPIGTSGSLFNNYNAGMFWYIMALTYFSFRKKKLFFKSYN